jgi:OmpA-OmpF porin, OOP family
MTNREAIRRSAQFEKRGDRMKLKVALLPLTIGLGFALASANTLAQQSAKPWYGGLSIGQSTVKIDDNALPIVGATATSLSKNETDTGFKAYVGYRLHQNFAVEGGYTDFGKTSATRTMTAPAVGTSHAEIKASGWNADAVGIWPIQNNFSLFGKLGVIFNEVKTTLGTSGAVAFAPGTNTSPKHSGSNWKLGIGAGYDFTPTVGARVEWERANKLGGDSTGGKSDFDLLSVGVVFRF